MAIVRSRMPSSTSARTGSPRRCWARGIGRGARVAYLGRSAPEVIELLLAASKIGAVIVPLNWRLSPRELAGVLEDSQAPLLIADDTISADGRGPPRGRIETRSRCGSSAASTLTPTSRGWMRKTP